MTRAVFDRMGCSHPGCFERDGNANMLWLKCKRHMGTSNFDIVYDKSDGMLTIICLDCVPLAKAGAISDPIVANIEVAP
jgi:hypothetical protein